MLCHTGLFYVATCCDAFYVEVLLGTLIRFPIQIPILIMFSTSASSSSFSSQLQQLEAHRYERYLSTSREVMQNVNFILVFSFFSRALYQLLAIFKVFILPDVKLSVGVFNIIFICVC